MRSYINDLPTLFVVNGYPKANGKKVDTISSSGRIPELTGSSTFGPTYHAAPLLILPFRRRAGARFLLKYACIYRERGEGPTAHE